MYYHSDVLNIKGWDFEDDSIYDDNFGFSNWDCLNYNPDAYEAYVSGGQVVFTPKSSIKL